MPKVRVGRGPGPELECEPESLSVAGVLNNLANIAHDQGDYQRVLDDRTRSYFGTKCDGPFVEQSANVRPAQSLRW